MLHVVGWFGVKPFAVFSDHLDVPLELRIQWVGYNLLLHGVFIFWGPHYHTTGSSRSPLIDPESTSVIIQADEELLVPGGRLCITMFSPKANISGSHCPVADFYRQSYAERESAGCKWPGEEMGTILKKSHKKGGFWNICWESEWCVFWIRFNIQKREKLASFGYFCQFVCREKYGASSQEWRGR